MIRPSIDEKALCAVRGDPASYIDDEVARLLEPLIGRKAFEKAFPWLYGNQAASPRSERYTLDNDGAWFKKPKFYRSRPNVGVVYHPVILTSYGFPKD